MPKKIRRPGNPIGRVARPRQWLRSGTGSGGGGPTDPAFHALTYDPNTYEMLGVKTGTGGLTTTHADTLYAPDYEGVQRAFGADQPVWSGGRVVRNWCQNSQDMTQVGYTATGTATIDSATAASLPADGDSVYQNQGGILSPGDIVVGSVVLTGNGTAHLTLHSTNPGTKIAITLTATPTRFSIESLPAINNWARLIVSRDAGDTVTSITATDWQFEIVNGQSDTETPGEKVVTGATKGIAKVFANLNGNTVLNNVVSEGTGAPLPEMPYLQYYPGSTNSVTNSADLTQWTPTGTPVVTYDQVGLTGAPNTASYLEDNDAASRESVTSANVTIPNDSNASTAVIYIKKDNVESRFPLIKLTLDGGTLQENRVRINTKTGAVYSLDTGVQEAIDLGDWWKLLIQTTNNTTGNVAAYIRTWSADALLLDGAADNTAVGSIIVGNSEIHVGKTIAQVRGLGPIFTTSAAVSVARTAYSFDALNHAETGAYYFENVKNGNGAILDAFLEVISPNYQLEDGVVVVTQGWTENTAQKVGTVSEAANQMVLNVDGVYGTDGVFNGTLLGIPFDLYRGGLYADKIRNLQRYDIANYAAGKTIIDGLMT